MAISTTHAPTTAALSDSYRIPSTATSLIKAFSKLPRASLLELVLQWLDDKLRNICPPYLGDNDESAEYDTAYPAAQNVEELREIYKDLQTRKGSKRDVIDRILEGDWRSGISLFQLASVDARCIESQSAAHRWTALRLTTVTSKTKKNKAMDALAAPAASTAAIPTVSLFTFLRNIQSELSPLVKAHYHLFHHSSLPLSILRIFVTDTPYSNPRLPAHSYTDSSRTLYVAFPDSCPFVYVSLSASSGTKASTSASDAKTLKRLVLQALPKALSRPHHRLELQTTASSAKSLPALLALRGNGRSNAANGSFSIFADGKIEESPLDLRSSTETTKQLDEGEEEDKENQSLPGGPQLKSSTQEKSRSYRKRALEGQGLSTLESTLKRRKLAAAARFGTTGADPSDGKGLDRLEMRIEDRLPRLNANTAEAQAGGAPHQTSIPETRHARPRTSLLDSFDPNLSVTSDQSDPADADAGDEIVVTLTFQGAHVFAGLRQLVEQGVIDPSKMPSWMTGEEGVSVGTAKDGNVLGGKAGGA